MWGSLDPWYWQHIGPSQGEPLSFNSCQSLSGMSMQWHFKIRLNVPTDWLNLTFCLFQQISSRVWPRLNSSSCTLAVFFFSQFGRGRNILSDLTNICLNSGVFGHQKSKQHKLYMRRLKNLIFQPTKKCFFCSNFSRKSGRTFLLHDRLVWSLKANCLLQPQSLAC